jgi:aerobic-type carbon monoxide dehydrogenase small subunit (CoxS/CutS family)
MRGLLIGIAVVLSAGLGGCSTSAQRQLASINTKADEAKTANKACLSDLAGNSLYASIAKHIPLDGSPTTLEQQADQSMATPQEAKVVLAWRSDFGSLCGFHAAPRIILGTTLISRTRVDFTWARYPQKSQITSAHLKFGGRRTSVRLRLHRGQAQS